MVDNELSEIRKLATLALFSDDELMDRLVLKGGNVLDLVYNVAFRASVDLDFSIEGEFAEEERREIERRIHAALEGTFAQEGYIAFDIQFSERPKTVTPDMRGFWGGYRVEFKLIEQSKHSELEGRERDLRLKALNLGPGHRKAFKIDISKFEYCRPKRPREIDGRTIYVYSPEMLVFEKLRAICQQMPEYAKCVRNPSQSPRARDFFDIHTILENFNLDLFSDDNVALLKHIFQAKRVPLRLIGRICEYREFHRPDFRSVQDTVRSGTRLMDFDFYFDYIASQCCDRLKTLWDV